MPKVTANGKKFNFPEGTTPEQMGEAIDSYFGSQAPAPEQPAAPTRNPWEGPVPEQTDPTKMDHGVQQAAQEKAYADKVANMGQGERALLGAGGAIHGLGIGAQQMLTQDPQRSWELEQQAIQQQRAMKPLEATTAGQIGAIGGNVGAAIPLGMALGAMAPAGVAGAIGAGVLEGGLMGAMAPTTKPGERAENIGYGAGFGGAVPAAGKAVRSLVGEGDVAMQKAADVLKRYGVGVSKSKQAGGGLNAASDYMIENTPIMSNIAKGAADKKVDKVRDALFNMLGTNAPKTNDEMAKITADLGADIGAMSKGKAAPVAGIKAGVDDVMKEYRQLLPAQRNPQIMKYAAQLNNISKTPGVRLKGETYQAIRSDMAADAAKAPPEHAKALRGMVKVLDDEFAKVLSPEEATALAAKKQQYRLARILGKQDIKEEAFDITKARTAVEREAKKGAVMPEARELLQAADVGIPKVKPRALTSGPVLATAGTALVNPTLVAKALGGAGLSKLLLNTGAPQRLANSPLLRKATARALKGEMQRELSDED